MIWKYTIKLWGSTKPSNINRIQSFQSKIVRKIVNALFYVRNKILHNNLNIPVVSRVASSYKSFHASIQLHPKPHYSKTHPGGWTGNGLETSSVSELWTVTEWCQWATFSSNYKCYQFLFPNSTSYMYYFCSRGNKIKYKKCILAAS